MPPLHFNVRVGISEFGEVGDSEEEFFDLNTLV